MITCRVCETEKPDTEFFRAAKKEYYDKICRICKNNRMRNRKRENKQVLVETKGGACVRCGYDKCIRALQFHHTDPNKKDPYFIRNRGGMTVVSIDRSLKELEDCILVCANCHAEIHDEWNNVGMAE